jgi:alpha-D-ribose 1-methylphosphonate 5-triphosphate synthase subunit PhnL
MMAYQRLLDENERLKQRLKAMERRNHAKRGNLTGERFIKRERHYGELVWTNRTTESIRREECLCLRCENMASKCTMAVSLYAIYKENNLALIVTRCPAWEEKVPV